MCCAFHGRDNKTRTRLCSCALGGQDDMSADYRTFFGFAISVSGGLHHSMAFMARILHVFVCTDGSRSKPYCLTELFSILGVNWELRHQNDVRPFMTAMSHLTTFVVF
jgi:hypothetical protein